VKTTLVAALSIAAILLSCSVAGADGAHTIALRSDATIVLPAQVTYLQEFEPLPPNLLKASLYRLPGGAIFSLNVAKPEDVGSCTAETDRDWKQFQDAQKVPGMSDLFRLAKADRRLVGKHPAIYSEGGTRTAAEARDGKPYHPVLTYSVCLRHGTIGLTLGTSSGDVTDADRRLFSQIVSSLKP